MNKNVCGKREDLCDRKNRPPSLDVIYNRKRHFEKQNRPFQMEIKNI